MQLNLESAKSIAKQCKLKCYSLYTYDLKSLPKSNAVRFVYLLKGRNMEKGIVEELNGNFLAPGCFLVPAENDNEIRAVFEKWNVSFKKRFILTN